ncbi:MAG: alpha/beta hydrolase fold domain-containing protein [Clostridia bacterium]|jgi:acetyl esterase|nr:alpha/beta hydrolase fold domain-containing protein [Clostridia bacterium]
MKTVETYRIIEKNKPDSLALMDAQMKKALLADMENFKKISIEYPHLKDEKAVYNLARRVWNKNAPPVFAKEDLILDGPCGKLPLRLYRNDEKNDKPCIIYFHGGGFIVGGLDSHDGIVSRLCLYSGANVVAVDYKLAPEFKYPVPLQEAAFVTDYIRANASRFRINPELLSYAGDSAGAFISLGAFLDRRDSGQDVSFIRTLLLYYGTVGLADSLSRRLYGGYWDGLTFSNLDRYEQAFADEEKTAAPMIDRDYTQRMPATYILGCELDPLADDSKVLHEILKAKGHTVEFSMKKGYAHAFLHYSSMLPGAEEALRESAEFFKKYLV